MPLPPNHSRVTYFTGPIRFNVGDRVTVGMQAESIFTHLIGLQATVLDHGRVPWLDFDEDIGTVDDPSGLSIPGRVGHMKCMYQEDLVLLARYEETL